MGRITIVFVEHSVALGGGAERALCDLIHGLDKDKFRPVLCCLYDLGELGEEIKAAGYRTYHNLIRNRYDPRSILKVASILKREGASVVYVTDAFLNVIVGRLAAFLAGTPRSVIVWQSYDTVLRTYTPPHRRAMLALTYRVLLPYFDKVIAVADAQKKYLMSTRNLPAQKIAVIHNAVDLREFARPVDAQAVRRSLQVPDGAKVVGVVAGLRPWKAHDMFLNAAAQVLREIPDTYFVLAGDGPERSRLENLARDLGIADHVRFLGKVDNVPTLLRAFDLSALSSVHEAFPLALLESMAARLPVVATDAGSVAEMVVDGVTGFVVPIGASDQFAHAMLRLLRDPELAKRFGEAGRKRVEQEYTGEHMINRSESLFLELANSTFRKEERHHSVC